MSAGEEMTKEASGANDTECSLETGLRKVDQEIPSAFQEFYVQQKNG